MVTKNQSISEAEFARNEQTLRSDLAAALDRELADCAIPDLPNDPQSGGVWSSMPTVDSKTAHKISVSVIERILGCAFQPAWIQRGGYASTDDAVTHVVSQIRKHCVNANTTATV